VLGRSGASFGKAHFCQDDYWPHNTALYVVDFFGNLPVFAFYFLRNIDFTRHNSGGAQQSLNRNFISPIPVAVPQLAEQEAIAEALSDADALIESLEQIVAKKRQIKQGAMQELLTGKRRLSGFTGKWQKCTLLQLAEGKKELFDDGDWIESEHITDEGIRLVQTGNIGVGEFIEKDEKKYIFEASFDSLRCKEVVQGDLLICRLAEPAGRACVLPDIGEVKIVTSVDVTIFRPPESVANRVFLANLFSMDQWFHVVSDHSGGTTHKRISRGALGRINIVIPFIEEQTAIATILSEMDAEIAALEDKLVKARRLKQGLMQELLTGRIRLV
jgi:type I restriction enzyme, S subunit